MALRALPNLPAVQRSRSWPQAGAVTHDRGSCKKLTTITKICVQAHPVQGLQGLRASIACMAPMQCVCAWRWCTKDTSCC